MFPKNFVLSPETVEKMQSFSFSESYFEWDVDSENNISLFEKSFFQESSITAPTLGEIQLSENGWKIFSAMRVISQISEKLRAWVWITERVLAQKEVQNG